MKQSKEPKASSHSGGSEAKPTLKELLLSPNARTDTLVLAPRDYDAFAQALENPLPRGPRLHGLLRRRRLTQVAAADKLGVAQPKVSALASYRPDGFSVERLMVFLTALDRDVEIVIRKKPRSRAGRISVVTT